MTRMLLSNSHLRKRAAKRERERRLRQPVMGIKRVTLRDCFYLTMFTLVAAGVFNRANVFIQSVETVPSVHATSLNLMTEPLIKTPEPSAIPHQTITPLPDPTADPKMAKNYDIWVGQYIDKYFDKPAQASEMRMVMHCLLYRESKHGIDKGFGDGGKAGGALQIWDETWYRFRSQMIKDGYATEIGNRLEMEQAIETTVYAIRKGRALEWGPILRSWNGVGWGTCPVPSFN